MLALEGVVIGDLAAPCELFERARGRDGERLYEVRVCGLRGEVSTQHVRLQVPYRLASLAWAQTVVVPGVEDIGAPFPPSALNALRRAATRGARLMSICTGAFALGEAGLLAHRRATTHWKAADEMTRRFPSVEVDPQVLFVDEGSILTSAGATAGIDLVLYVIRADHGVDVAMRVARASVAPLERDGGQAQYIDRPPVSPAGSSMARLVAWLEEHLAEELSLDAIASHAGMSVRTLSRRFREQTGTTPARWLKAVRVRHARQLLETSELSVEHVAEQSGFRSATVLRTHFQNALGTSPSAYRRSFAPPAPRGGDAPLRTI